MRELRSAHVSTTITDVPDGDLDAEALRAIMLALTRIEEKLNELLGETKRTMAKKKISPETRAALVDVRREIRALIELLQARLHRLEQR